MSLIALTTAVFAGGALTAQSLQNATLNSLQKGMWELRAIGGGPSKAAQSRICLGDPEKMVQIQHGDADCNHRIISQQADKVTISYSCPGVGQGMTTIRKETNRLVQIETQGIRGGTPFNYEVEGRHRGPC